MVTSSYLEFPRINFEGRFQADVATNNNERLNFLFASVSEDNMLYDRKGTFNPIGTNTWRFVDCAVTSVVYDEDTIQTSDDPVIGLPIVTNPSSALAKIVDIDVDDQLLSSVIYGMKLGINYDPFEPKPNSFIGDFKPAVIASDCWLRQAENREVYYQQRLGTRIVSKIENVIFSEVKNSVKSKILDFFQQKIEEGKDLSIRFTLFNYSKNPSDDWFTYGNVVGSIGIYNDGESLQFPESRVMTFLYNPPIKVDQNDQQCKNLNDWMHGAYFDVDIEKSVISIDMSNSFAIGIQGKICKLNKLYLGVTDSETELTSIIEEIPYTNEIWYNKNAGILDVHLNDALKLLIINHAKVVVVTTHTHFEDKISIEGKYPACRKARIFFSNESSDGTHWCSSDGPCESACVYTLLEETSCMVRPMDIFIERMEKNDNKAIKFKMNYFGKKRPGKTIQLKDTSQNDHATEKELAYKGKFYDHTFLFSDSSKKAAETDVNGIATFEFKAGDVGEPRRGYRLHGQVFTFGYCSHDCILDNPGVKVQPCIPTNEGNYLVFLIFSPFNETRPYFWDKHIEPLFKQYQNLYPAMNHIVKLGDYDDVTKPQNIRLISTAMSLPMNHASYMPVTRDMPPSTQNMILEWLKTPNLPRNWEDIDQKLFKTAAFCELDFLYSEKEPDENKIELLATTGSKKRGRGHTLAESEMAHKFSQASNLSFRKNDDLPNSEVLGLVKILTDVVGDQFRTLNTDNSATESLTCTSADDLKKALQIAIALEFSTIPPYMTALYSIKDGFNQEVYNTIRSVVMQEMIHMAQAANILISIGGQPKLENPEESFIPKCFPTRLPGGVLPNLIVRLAKASPQHVRDIFMMIEFPDKILYDGKIHEGEKSTDSMTIGMFYSEIKNCVNKLYKSNSISFPSVDDDRYTKQLKWPWDMYDTTSMLYQVKSINDANSAIDMIVEQGEGTDQLDPTYLGSQELAHFYKFGEIACKKRLNSSADHKLYSYKGEDIEFVSEGVWPMRDSPSSKDISANTYAYQQAKVFHTIYRSLLNSLQLVFNGEPNKLEESMYVMEAMQIQAKRLMQIEIPAPDGHVLTCGPIFDYTWQDPACGIPRTIEPRDLVDPDEV